MDLGAALSHGWETFKRYPAPLVLATVVIALISLLVSLVASALPPVAGFALSALPQGLLTGGIILIARKASGGSEPQLAEVLTPFKERQVDWIVMGLAIQAGLILCVVGVVITYVLFFFAPILVAQGMDFRVALSKAKDITAANFGDVLLLALVVGVLNIVGAIPCGLGLLVTVPITSVAMVKVYEQITGDTAAAPEPLPPESQA